ncbi:MAG: hypothetical protein ABR612_02740 [Chromatocurvus sp.]
MLESPATHRLIAVVLLISGFISLRANALDAPAPDVVALDNRQWATATNGPDIRWPDADTYCADLSLGGHDDWRLPSCRTSRGGQLHPAPRTQ